MIFSETELRCAFVIEPRKLEDERGFFARVWCEEEFKNKDLNPRLKQCNISYNYKKGTVRGMHYQVAPHEEAKLVRCIRGAIHDVAIDLRRDSPTFAKHISVVLTADNHKALYIPEKFAHGFQTLVDNCEVFYQMSEFYAPECSRGIRWNDPFFNISWPLSDAVVSARDQSYPDFCESSWN